MSLNGFRPTRIEMGRVISTFSKIQPLAEPIESPLRGNLLEGRLRRNGMPPKGFVDPIMSDGTGFHSNISISELIKHVTQAIKASDVASTPPVAKTTNGATVTKMSRPLTESPPRVGARGRQNLQGDRAHGHRTIAKILRKGYMRVQK